MFADSLRYTSALAIALAVVLLVITTVIALCKWKNGTILVPRNWPEIPKMISLLTLFSAVPVLIAAYASHFNGMH